MRVALATWNGRIAPVLDVCRRALLVDVADGRVTARREETLPGSDPLAQADRLVELGSQALLCGAISKPLGQVLAARGVHVVPFVAGDVEGVLAAYLAGTLPGPAWSMPGCCGRRGGFRGGVPARHGCRRRGRGDGTRADGHQDRGDGAASGNDGGAR